MTFVFDENMPPALAVALRDLREPVTSVHLLNVRGTKDPELIELIAKLGGTLIARDRRMLRNAALVAAFRDTRLSAFFLHDGEAPGLEIARVVFRCWPEMKRWVAERKQPFFAAIYPTNTAVREIRPGP